MNNIWIAPDGSARYGRRLPDYSDKKHLSCQYPIIIYHPYFKNRFVRFKRAWLNGVSVDLSYLSSDSISDSWSSIVKRYFAVMRVNPDINELDNFFIIGDNDSYPIYLSVPCGKCVLCTQSRTNDLMNRCVLETYTSKYKPLFVTLTYDNEHLPLDGVRVDDTQRFLKRLRSNLDYSFGCHINLRYVICSEYGKNTHRPHYHMILWNMPFFEDRRIANDSCVVAARLGFPTSIDFVHGFQRMIKFIQDSWRNGFVSVQVAKDPSARYLMKYIGKGSNVPAHKNPTFIHWSRRRGIGFNAFVELKDWLLANPQETQVTINDPKVGKLQTITIPKYYERLLCPSPSSVSKRFLNLMHDFRFECYSFISSTKGSLLNSPLHDDVKLMFSDVCQYFTPFRDACKLDINPLFSEDKFEFLEYCKHLPIDIDDCYWHIYYLFESLLHWVSPLLDYMVGSIPWKDTHSFVKSEFIYSDDRRLKDKVYLSVQSYNNTLKKIKL